LRISREAIPATIGMIALTGITQEYATMLTKRNGLLGPRMLMKAFPTERDSLLAVADMNGVFIKVIHGDLTDGALEELSILKSFQIIVLAISVLLMKKILSKTFLEESPSLVELFSKLSNLVVTNLKLMENFMGIAIARWKEIKRRKEGHIKIDERVGRRRGVVFRDHFYFF
jgi:hypothetical protein